MRLIQQIQDDEECGLYAFVADMTLQRAQKIAIKNNLFNPKQNVVAFEIVTRNNRQNILISIVHMVECVCKMLTLGFSGDTM